MLVEILVNKKGGNWRVAKTGQPTKGPQGLKGEYKSTQLVGGLDTKVNAITKR